jgi:pyridoxal phosphate enzyme (YggS family)
MSWPRPRHAIRLKETPVPDITAGLAAIRTRIARAEAEAGRPPGAVTLVAVSKTHPASAVEAALAAGQRLFGENRVQEAKEKFPALKEAWPDLRLHLIGPLQTNKVRDAVALFDVIETIDRPKLARAVAEEMARSGRRPDILIQVNIGREPQKAGVDPDQADALIDLCRDEFDLAPCGVMGIPPADADPAPYFDALAALAARHGFAILSMGMSGDFPSAISRGATHVRVGSAIFGHRG